MKLVLAISSLNSGGAERVMSIMANHWAEKDNDVTIIMQANTEPFYDLHPKVKLISLDSAKKSNNFLEAAMGNLRRALKIRKEFKKIRPEIIISFTTAMNILCIIAGKSLGIPTLISERYNPYRYQPPKFWQFARRWTYPLANYIIVQSENSRRFFNKFCKNGKVKIIYNPVNNGITDHRFQKSNENIFLSVGRLKYVKGQDLLIKAFSKLGLEGWKLYLVGEGEARNDLENLIKHLELQNFVFLPGNSNNVKEYYKRATIFVLSSRAEGFPNALLEAMSFGLPVISTDCESGPSIMVDHKRSGLLVPNKNIEALANAMYNLANDPVKRKELGNAARTSVRKFTTDAIMKQWDILIQEVRD